MGGRPLGIEQPAAECQPGLGLQPDVLLVAQGTQGVPAPARATAVPPRAVRLAIHEGRNRQVRRMCEAVGLPVVRLVRTRIGPIADRRLRPGGWRQLTPAEIRSLQEAAVPRPRED